MINSVLEILKGYGIDPQFLLMGALLCTVAYCLAYYRFLLNIFDPLVIFIITMIASGTLILCVQTETDMRVEFFVFTALFWLGFCCFGRADAGQRAFYLDSRSLFELELIVIVLFLLIMAGNLYIGATSGFPLFAENPSVAKVDTFTGGAGAIKRLNSAPYQFFASGCVVLAILRRKRKFYLLLFALGSFVIVLDGSKGALAPVIAIFAFVANRDGLRNYLKGNGKRIMIYAGVALILGLGFALLVSNRSAGYGESGLALLGARIVLYGDIVAYYYPNRGTIPELRGIGPLDYLSYLFSGVLGMLRLVEYKDALGTVIMGARNSSRGPNAQYFVRADLFFGPVVGSIYCFVIGFLCGWLRKGFFRYNGNSAVSLVLKLTLGVLAVTLAVESSFFMLEIFDLALLVAPLWLVARICTTAVMGPGLSPLVAGGRAQRVH